MAHILIDYNMGNNALDPVIDTLTNIKTATDSVNEKYPTIDCKARLAPRQVLGLYILERPKYRIEILVEMMGNQTDALEEALKSYIGIAGVPSFVERGSDYTLVERTLKEYGQTLKRKIIGSLAGKHVVPLAANP